MIPANHAGLYDRRRLPVWAAAACVVWSAGTAPAATAARTYGGGPTLTIARQPVTGSLPHAASTDALLAPGAAPVKAARRAYRDVLLPGGRAAPRIDASWSLLPSAAAARHARLVTHAGVDFPILAIRVDFLGDSLHYQSSSDGRFDLRPYVDVNGDTVDVAIDPPPHNREYFRAHMAALDRFYDAQSHGEVAIRSEVYPVASDSAYHLPDVGRYGPWLLFRGYNPYDAAQAFVKDAIRAAANDPDIPWGDFALDGREVRVMIFHAGPDLQSDINADSPRDLPSFFIGLEDSVPIADGAYYVKYATVVPETANQDGAYGALNGVLAHETGHQLGLPDIYNTQIGFPVVGFWSLMDSGNLVAGPTEDPRNGSTIYVSGIIPPSLDAWSKAVLFPERFLRGGFAPSLVDTLPAIENEAAILQVPISASEYFLLENRQTDVNGDDSIFVETDSLTHVILGPKAGRGDAPPLPEYDALLPGSGILVWHVDEEQIFRQFDNGYSLNDDPARPGLSVVEADGTFDLGDFGAFPYTVGSPWDPFYVGNRDSLTPSTSPSTHANGGGDSHISIRVLSKSGLRMALETTQAWLLPGFPFPLAGDTLGTGSPMVVDLFKDGMRWILTPASDKITGVAWQNLGGGTTLPLFGNGVFAASTDGAAFRDEVAFGDNAFGGALITANAVAATTRSNELYVWNGAGERVQLWPGLPPVTSAPSFLGNDLLVGCEDGRLYRLSMLGGFTSIGPSLSAPVVSTPRNVVSGTDTLIAWASANGVLAVSGPAGVQTATLATATAWEPQVTLGSFAGSYDVLVADGSGRVWRVDASAATRAGWPVASGDASHSAPVMLDVDGDGDQEVAIVSVHGVVSSWNANASPVRLWPQQGDVEAGDGGITMSTPLVTRAADAGPDALLLALGSGNVLLHAPGGAAIAGWPLSLNEAVHATPTIADVTGDGVPDVIVPARDGLLYAYAPGDLACPAGGCIMPMQGHDSARTGALPAVAPVVPVPTTGPLTTQMYLAPNPVRLSAGRTVRLGYSLAAGATSVTADVFDVAGRRIVQLQGGTSPNDNSIEWTLDGVPPGPYMCKLTVLSGARSEEHVMLFAVRP